MKKISIQSDWIKILALITMSVAHIDLILTHTYWLNNTIGRMAFPLFAFLLMSNFCTYHPVKKYISRLTIFGIITQVIFWVFHIPCSNILFTFLYAIIFISIAEKTSRKYNLLHQAYYLILAFIVLFPLIWYAGYNVLGFFFLLALYAYLQKHSKTNYWAVLLTSAAINSTDIVVMLFSVLTTFSMISIIHIKRSNRIIKWWWFYAYYPAHLLLLQLLKTIW